MILSKNKPILVTGGAGFIGSSFIRYGLSHVPWCPRIVNLDILTYAANLDHLCFVEGGPRYRFVRGDICDRMLVETICREEHISAIVHFAAESHVDRSIKEPKPFYQTNVEGTLTLLEVVRKLGNIHFHHISTDEVYGSLDFHEHPFTEESPYRPNSPYAASKAASDHFVRAYGRTYNIPYTLSHCSNNYGPCQHEEKFIPRIIASCVRAEPIPIYGTGSNVRDWIFVDDHAAAIWAILERGEHTQTYDIGGDCEMNNLTLVHEVIEQVARSRNEDVQQFRALMQHVPDRPGHDLRYALSSHKIMKTLQWRPHHDFAQGICKTVAWYLEHLKNCSMSHISV